MSISRDRVEALAELARLDLTDDELDTMTSQLATILEYATSLTELDVSDVPEMTAAPVNRGLRSDDAAQTLERDEVLRLAPRHDQEHYLVPKVVSND